jgi:hypothetical protein
VDPCGQAGVGGVGGVWWPLSSPSVPVRLSQDPGRARPLGQSQRQLGECGSGWGRRGVTRSPRSLLSLSPDPLLLLVPRQQLHGECAGRARVRAAAGVSAALTARVPPRRDPPEEAGPPGRPSCPALEVRAWRAGGRAGWPVIRAAPPASLRCPRRLHHVQREHVRRAEPHRPGRRQG